MSEIVFIIAPIGGGKSRHAVDFVCHELIHGKRPIIGNLAIKRGWVADWADEFYPEAHIDVASRIRRIDDSQVPEFYRQTVLGPLLDVTKAKHQGKEVSDGVNLQPRQGDGGILFVLDEVHSFFSARRWATVGLAVEFYMSQLRKLNDDLILITQHPDKVDANFRRNATEWIFVENMARRPLWAGVRLPGWFVWGKYLEQPSRKDKPVTHGKFKLDFEGRQKLYDTMAGVGLSGKVSPEKVKRRGLHWAAWPVGFGVVLVLAFFFPKFVFYSVGKAVGTTMGSVQKGVQSSLVKQSPHTSESPASFRPPAPNQTVLTSSALAGDSESVPVASTSVAPELYCTGWTYLPDGRWEAFLSNGDTVYGPLVNGLSLLDRHYIVAAGRIILIRPSEADRQRGSAVPVLAGTQGREIQAADRSAPGASFSSAPGSLSMVVVGQAYMNRHPRPVSGNLTPVSQTATAYQPSSLVTQEVTSGMGAAN